VKKPFDADSNALDHVQKLDAYVPGKQPHGEGWVKLNTNENPYLPSPKVAKAVACEVEQLRRYPEPTCLKLRTAIGERFGLTADNVIIGNGSDNILDLITRCYVPNCKVGQTVPSYSLYPVVAGMSGHGIIDVPFTRSIELDVDAIATADTSVFFLASPNAPTGVEFPLSKIEAILQRIDGLLVVDEAYVDFGGESAVGLLKEYENLVVVRTFSKSYSLAGMRIGFGMASKGVIGMLNRVRDAYNVDRIAQVAAQAAFDDVEYFESRRQQVIVTREMLHTQLDALDWFTYPSVANFLFTEPQNALGQSGAEVAASLFAYLNNAKVLVRYFPEHPLTCSFIRVSIGTETEMEFFLTTVKSWLKVASQK
jgi:histidinol-phosphate aminotransferase